MSDRQRKNGSRMGERLIRPGGRVKWHGHWYVLDDSPANIDPDGFEALPNDQRTGVLRSDPAYRCPRYDGRMDGRRGLFYDYGDWPTLLTDDGIPEAVYLHNVNDEWPGPACVGGVFVWERFALAPTPRPDQGEQR